VIALRECKKLKCLLEVAIKYTRATCAIATFAEITAAANHVSEGGDLQCGQSTR